MSSPNPPSGPGQGVYLAGPIRGLRYGEVVEQRRWLAERLWSLGIVTIDPMRWKHHLGQTPAGVHRTLGYDPSAETYPLTAAKGIVARDRFDVARCAVVLADFTTPQTVELYDAQGKPVTVFFPSIGTCVEFGWANAYGKPIVSILPAGNVHEHPFLLTLTDFRVFAYDEAFDVLRAILTQDVPTMHSVRAPSED